MYVCVYTYVCVYIYIHTHVHVCIYLHMQMLYIHIITYLCIHIQMYQLYTCIHAFMHAYTTHICNVHASRIWSCAFMCAYSSGTRIGMSGHMWVCGSSDVFASLSHSRTCSLHMSITGTVCSSLHVGLSQGFS